MANTNTKEYRAAHGFKVVCFSLYDDDIRELDAKVCELKRMGVTNANKSALVRFALEHVDLEAAARAIAATKFARRVGSESTRFSPLQPASGQPVLSEETR